jgi:hypothetical protein
MTLRKNTLAVWMLTLILIMGLGGGAASAGVAMSPLKQEVTMKPGETEKVVINLAFNNRLPADVPQKVTLAIVDVLATEEGSLVFKDAGTLANSASKWITPSMTETTMDPGTMQKVECQIAVPLGAAPGEYYAALLMTLVNPVATDNGVTIQYRIASGIFVTVEGRTFAKEARIARCELIWPQTGIGIQPKEAATQPAAAATQPADAGPALPKVQLLLENTGKARFDGSGKLTILDDQRRIVLVTSMTTRRSCVFGGDSRLFEALIDKPLKAGRYTMRVEMDYQSSWAKARRDMPVEILPEQAAVLAQAKQGPSAGKSLVEATPDKLASVVPAGATRNLAITVKNLSDAEVTCTAAVAGSSGAGLTLRPEQFTIAKGGRRTLEVRVDSKSDMEAGQLSALINVAASAEGGSHSELSIPVNIQQKSER